jgi:hypothetical protein
MKWGDEKEAVNQRSLKSFVDETPFLPWSSEKVMVIFQTFTFTTAHSPDVLLQHRKNY